MNIARILNSNCHSKLDEKIGCVQAVEEDTMEHSEGEIRWANVGKYKMSGKSALNGGNRRGQLIIIKFKQTNNFETNDVRQYLMGSSLVACDQR